MVEVSEKPRTNVNTLVRVRDPAGIENDIAQTKDTKYDTICFTTHLRNVSFSSFIFSASFALNFITRSTSWPFSVCVLRSFSSSEQCRRCSAVCSSRNVEFSSFSSWMELVSICTSARSDWLILICSVKLEAVADGEIPVYTLRIVKLTCCFASPAVSVNPSLSHLSRWSSADYHPFACAYR